MKSQAKEATQKAKGPTPLTTCRCLAPVCRSRIRKWQKEEVRKAMPKSMLKPMENPSVSAVVMESLAAASSPFGIGWLMVVMVWAPPVTWQNDRYSQDTVISSASPVTWHNDRYSQDTLMSSASAIK